MPRNNEGTIPATATAEASNATEATQGPGKPVDYDFNKRLDIMKAEFQLEFRKLRDLMAKEVAKTTAQLPRNCRKRERIFRRLVASSSIPNSSYTPCRELKETRRFGQRMRMSPDILPLLAFLPRPLPLSPLHVVRLRRSRRSIRWICPGCPRITAGKLHQWPFASSLKTKCGHQMNRYRE